MESHPVPQNVTSFEFHLIGDMTLKQFAYLASGLTISYLTFVLLFPSAPVIALPIMAISGLFGAALAFLPISDRPFSHWVSAYFKAVYSPTQAKWKAPSKNSFDQKSEETIFINRLNLFLSSENTPLISDKNPLPLNKPVLHPQQPLQIQPVFKQPVKTTPQSPLTSRLSIVNLQRLPQVNKPTINQTAKPTPAQNNLNQTNPLAALSPNPTFVSAPPQPATKPPSSGDLNRLVDLAKETQLLQNKVVSAEHQIKTMNQESSLKQNDGQYQAQFKQVFDNLKSLVKQTDLLYQQAAKIDSNFVKPKPLALKPAVHVVNPVPAQTIPQLALTSLPNVINGIVTDASGSYLDSVIVIIHDKDGLPVRALKTNKLGQFTGATPLPSGIYTVTLEKDNLEFDTLEVTLNNQIMSPLQISARKGEVND